MVLEADNERQFRSSRDGPGPGCHLLSSVARDLVQADQKLRHSASMLGGLEVKSRLNIMHSTRHQ